MNAPHSLVMVRAKKGFFGTRSNPQAARGYQCPAGPSWQGHRATLDTTRFWSWGCSTNPSSIYWRSVLVVLVHFLDSDAREEGGEPVKIVLRPFLPWMMWHFAHSILTPKEQLTDVGGVVGCFRIEADVVETCGSAFSSLR
jgi:hypothetical protein